MVTKDSSEDAFELALVHYIEGQSPDNPAAEALPQAERDRLEESVDVIDGLRELSSLLGKSRVDPLARPSREQSQKLLGRYELIRRLGSGGTSTVHLASDPELDRLVAIKELRPESSVTDARTSWLQTEARSLARIRSENVLQVLDVGEEDGSSFLITEYVKGPSLRDVIEELRGAAPPGQAQPRPHSPSSHKIASIRADALLATNDRVQLVAKLARGLQTCHRERVLHRDIKPENILLRRSDQPVLIDFGLAHLAGDDQGSHVTQVLMGTPLYLAPEQISEGRTGARAETDIYALGMVLHELVTLAHPFRGLPRERVLESIASGRVPSVRATDRSLPKSLAHIITRALELDPDQRYASMSAFAADLEAFVSGGRVTATAQPRRRAVTRWARQCRSEILSAAAVAAIGLGAGALYELEYSRQVSGIREQVLVGLEEVATLEAPGQFEMALTALSRARFEQESLQGALQFPWRDSTEADVASLAGAISKRLRKSIVNEALQLDVEADPWRRRDSCAKLKLRWSRVIDQARQAGASTGLRTDRVHVALPDGTRMFSMGDDSGPTLTEWLEPSATPPGRYRLVRDIDGERRVIEVDLLENQLAAKPDWNPLPRSLAGTFVRVSPPQGEPFWITQAPVTNAELEAAFDPEDVADVNRRRAAFVTRDPFMAPRGLDHDPANVPSSRARAYANRVGCRLPSVAEVFLAEPFLIDRGGQIQTTYSAGELDASWSFNTPFRRGADVATTSTSPPIENIPVDAIPLAGRIHLVRESMP